jgi:alkylhydroperoxidase/carboxymuconolactone decarboxylase family protein YurZ
MEPPPPPPQYEDFVARFPELAEGWEKLGRGAAAAGPLDEHVCRLVKLGIAVGARLEGPVHASTRKALAAGIPREELEQVVALAAGTIGLPGAVAAFTWVREVPAAS